MPIIYSCHFGDCKALLVMNLTPESSAITNVQTFTFANTPNHRSFDRPSQNQY